MKKKKLTVPTFSGYKLDGWDKLHGLDISIENARGTFRKGTDPDGNEWSRFMFHDYGYIKRTQGTDGDHVDVYIGPDRLSEKVYIVHQLDPKTGNYDEDKVFLGFRRWNDARRAFYWQYDHPTKFFGSMEAYHIDEFKQMLRDNIGVKLKKSRESDQLEKGKRMPIGTVSHGRKKVGEGKWRPLPKGRQHKKGELPDPEELQVTDSRGEVKNSLPALGETTAEQGKEIGKRGELTKVDYNVSGPVYRGITLEDYKRIREQGYVDTDMRGAISKDEGMNLTARPETAIEYIPSGEKGVVIAIDSSDIDTWGIKSDHYIRTDNHIPKDAILGVSDVMDKAAEEQKFEVSSTARKIGFLQAGVEMLEEAGHEEKAREWKERMKSEVKKRFPDQVELQRKAIRMGRGDRKTIEENKQYIDIDDVIQKSRTRLVVLTKAIAQEVASLGDLEEMVQAVLRNVVYVEVSSAEWNKRADILSTIRDKLKSNKASQESLTMAEMASQAAEQESKEVCEYMCRRLIRSIRKDMKAGAKE